MTAAELRAEAATRLAAALALDGATSAQASHAVADRVMLGWLLKSAVDMASARATRDVAELLALIEPWGLAIISLGLRLDVVAAAVRARSVPCGSGTLTGGVAGQSLALAVGSALTIDRLEFYNGGGGAVEFDVETGGTRFATLRLAANARDTVGGVTLASAGALAVRPVSGTSGNLAATKWSALRVA